MSTEDTPARHGPCACGRTYENGKTVKYKNCCQKKKTRYLTLSKKPKESKNP